MFELRDSNPEALSRQRFRQPLNLKHCNNMLAMLEDFDGVVF
jgi:hypothetical protein